MGTQRAKEDEFMLRRIAARVYSLRNQRGISALGLAERAGIHRNTIYRLESGICLCKIGQIWRLARALDVTIDDLMNDAPLLVQIAHKEAKAR